MFSLGFGLALPTFDSEVVQSTGGFHDLIRNAFFGVPENIFDNARALHACQGMLYLDSNACQLSVGLFFSAREFSVRWLFFSPGRSA
jgi:hypothetical protein